MPRGPVWVGSDARFGATPSAAKAVDAVAEGPEEGAIAGAAELVGGPARLASGAVEGGVMTMVIAVFA